MSSSSTPRPETFTARIQTEQAHARQRVLVVDDDPTMRRWIQAILGKLDVDVEAVESGLEALHTVGKTHFDIALLDLQMPGMNGYDLADALKEEDNGLALIFLTAADDTTAKVTAFERGASDYITKPFEPAELLARVRSALRTQALVDELERLATTDRLTGLLNRRALNDVLLARLHRLDDALQASPGAGRAAVPGFTVLFMDLDRFKVINDSLGHQLGDELLVNTARNIHETLDAELPTDASDAATVKPLAIARNGGDEFVVAIDGVTDPARASQIADRLVETISRPMEISEFSLSINASIGIKPVVDARQTVTEILRDADTAMYRAKNMGKGRAVLFDRSMHEAAYTRLALENDLKTAIEAEQVILYYQPIVSLETNRIVRFEGLARWEHPTKGLLPPNLFIPVAEETGLINPLGELLLHTGCRQVARWYEQFGREHAPAVNVNLSPKQLYAPDVAGMVAQCIRAAGISPEHLGIELTESAIVQDVDSASQTMQALRDMGIYLSIDDFGTGYSSMATLRRFPFDAIKIDGAFVQSMCTDRSCTAIISAICTLAHNLGMSVVAEGVETLNELTMLQGLECTNAQGYLISRPVPAAEATNLIREHGGGFFSHGVYHADRPACIDPNQGAFFNQSA